ncbi:hypothetical protein LTR66_007054, partial [Elasticomyces elasticus]
MPFYPPSWVPKLSMEPPDSISLDQFIFDENYERYPLGYSKPPFTCGLSGKSYSALELRERVDFLARGLSKELGWTPNGGTEWDKVCGVFSVNTIDSMTLAWATHRLGGISTPANAAYSTEELAYQLKDAGAKCLFTCLPLLRSSVDAAKIAGIPSNRIYILELPKDFTPGMSADGFKTVNQLIAEGSKLSALEQLQWSKGEGARRTAFLCYSSGTSGLPKGVMISHKNVIANTLQISTMEKPYRDSQIEPGNQSAHTETVLGLLPFSHIYGLVVICHCAVYRGDQIVVLPKWEFETFLSAIQRFKIQMLYLVPPMIITMCKSKQVMSKYDLSSVGAIFTGAAPLGKETADDLQTVFPKWSVLQGYGLTETSTVVCMTDRHDIWFGSSGSLLPGIEARLVTIEGNEITGYDQPGELWVKGPAVVLGYLKNEKATKETFVDGYMRTGDEAVFRKNPKSGHEH